MELIIKSFTGLFFLMILTVTGIGLIGTSVKAKNADAFLYSCVDRMENSDYAADVIAQCQEQAEEQGYQLRVQVYGSAEKYGTAGLTYHYSIPILGIDDSKSLTAAMC